MTPGPGASPFGPGSTAPAPTGGPAVPGGSTSTAPAGPPTLLIALTGLVAAIGIALGAVFWGQWIAGIGWLLAGPVAICILAMFISTDTSRRAQPIYLRPGWMSAAYTAVMILIVAGVIVGALGFAFWVGRR
ncbi:hypothetical protein GYA93_14370 [Gordonia desulfuricans]|uniref:Uncharacterized protein n=1 Tax=Gordonia desulfuricans TaxID=89051 RepID=A0A7K3LT93_9ACTN|nr:hypothetical protein [Gordonia desulfuricans]NDK90757.1 hypothetical protein [Gordonia desulfuricans]